ncbi:MAG: PAS domain S-box protein [Anaerolineales bacterium]|nr:PAS domain S-box protein [Anaerolineales bacterium]
MRKLIYVRRLSLIILVIFFSTTIQAYSNIPANTTLTNPPGYTRSAASKSNEGEPVQTQEVLRFDRAVLNTDTQNSGAILQDNDGFLWIGTNGSGLFRFDGYDLKVYKPGGINAISDTTVHVLYEDRDNFIWIGTNGGGLNRYDKETDSFTQYKHDPQNPESICGDAVVPFRTQVIQEDPQGNLWVGTQNGLSVLDKATETFKSYRHDPRRKDSLSHDKIGALLFDSQGVLWVGTEGGGLNRFDQQTETFTHYLYDTQDPKNFGESSVSSLLEDKQGFIWIATWNGLYKFDRTTESFSSYFHNDQNPNSLTGNKINAIYQDQSGKIWITYNNSDQLGLSIFEPQTNTYTHYTHDPEKNFSVSSTSITGVYQDRADIIWIVNNTGLIDKLDPHKPAFTLFRHDPQNPNSISSNVVVPVIQDRQGNIWVGTEVNLQMYDKQTGAFTDYLKGYYPALYEDPSGVFWLGSTIPGNLYIYDHNSNKIVKTFSYNPNDPNSLVQNRQIFSILGDNQDSNILWIATADSGMDKFDKSTETFTHYQTDPQNSNSLSSNNLMTLFQDSEGILWIPTLGGGLDRYDPLSKTFTHFLHDPQNPSSISSDIVNVVFEDKDGWIWAGTALGFDRFDRQAKTFKRYNSDTGYPVTMIASINQDDEGHLWMGSLGGDGLVRFDPETETMRVYQESDGLQGNVFYPLNALRDKDGMMWFGGSNGLNTFYPQEIKDNTYIPSVAITALKQGGEPLPLGKSPERAKQITLDWQNNFFEFEYTALNYTQSSKNQYMYKLEGLDKDWFNAGTRRFGRYSGLGGGNYTLHILGSNNDGVWNEQGVSIQVTVVPPWWKTWWFYTLAVLAGLGGFLLVYRVKNNQLKTARIAAQSIRESEENYRMLFENTPMGIIMNTFDGKIIAFNHVIKEMLGYTEEDLKEEELANIYQNPQDRDALLEQLKQDNVVHNFETVLKRQDDSLFHASITATPITLAGQGSLLSVVEDITGRKRVEEALEKRIVALTQPLDNAEEIKFEDILNLSDIQHLQDLFAETFGVAALITRPDGTPISQQSNFSALCGGIIRNTEIGAKNCNISDAIIGKHNPSGPNIQPCLSAGLCNAGVSITVGGRHIANWLIGQVRNEAQDEEEIMKYAREIGADETAFRAAYRQVPTMSQEQFEKIAHLLFVLSNQVSTSAYQNIQQARFITQRKQAEAAVLESERKYRNLYESMIDGYAFVSMDGAILESNATYQSMLGYTSEELQRLSYMDITPSKWHSFESDIVKNEVLRKGYSPVYEKEYRRKDGAIFPVELRTSLVKNAEGEPQGMFAIVRDITERKRADEALQQANLVVENSPAVLFRWKPEEGWPVELVSNNVTQFGYTPEELLSGATLYVSMMHPEDVERVAGEIQEHVQRGADQFQQEYRLITKDGNIRWVDDHSVIERDSNGHIMCLQGIVIDVTERKKADEEIRKLNDELEQRVIERTAQLETAVKELEAFSYSVSHDLRAPLRAMDGFSRILLEEYAPQLSNDAQHYLELVRDSSKKMTCLVDDLLAFSRFSRQPLNKQAVVMKDLVEQALKTVEIEYKDRQVDIKIGSLCDVQGDAAMLHQVWVNLLSNAIKFTRKCEFTLIEIGSTQINDECVYYVKDNGVGFDMKYADKIFSVFQRLHSEKEFEGTGVGLAIVQRIIERHGGRVWADAQENHGAELYFSLPYHKELSKEQ